MLGANSYFDGLIRKRPDTRTQSDAVLRTLNEQHARLRVHFNSLRRRQAELIRACAYLVNKKDKPRAKIYADEIAETLRVLSVIKQSELIVEKLRLRLETAREIGNLGVTMRPLAGALAVANAQLHTYVPEVARQLGEAGDALVSIMSVSPPDAGTFDPTLAISDENVESVLRDARAQAEAELKQQIDGLGLQSQSSVVEYLKTHGVDSIEDYLRKDITAGSSSAVQTEDGLLYVTLSEEKTVPTQRLLEYLRANGGTVDLGRCCRELGLSREEVFTGLKTLEARGKIKLGYPSESVSS